MPSPNFTWEAARLLGYAGRVATAIRMNTPYSGEYDPRGSHHAVDVMWLSDSLHHFERLGHALQESNLQTIEDTCNSLLAIYKDYGRSDTGMKSEPVATFERQTLFRLDECRATLTELRDKARALRVHDQER